MDNPLAVRSFIRSTLSVMLGVTLLASACGSGDQSTTEAGTSPLGEFLGQPDFIDDREGAEAQFRDEERARQELIAECMRVQGFEYTPQDPSDFISFSDEDGLEWGSEEWTAKWGFGITTQRFSQSQVGPDLLGFDDSSFEEEAMFEDPNQDYIDSLSEQEQQAYYEALYGKEEGFPAFADDSLSEEEMEAELENFDWEPQGCEGEAWADDDANSFYREFEDELQDMYERMQADSRVEEMEREVRECVTGKGHDFIDIENIYERFETELQEIDADIGYEDFGPSEEEMASMSEAELEEMFRTPIMPELSEQARTKLGELQAEELALAEAVNECGGGFEAQRERMAEIQAEYEREFLETYADELEPFRAG